MEAIALEKGECGHVESVSYDLDNLDIVVSLPNKRVKVRFVQPIGFRNLDEGDICEYWHSSTVTGNWLLEIKSDGWKSQELEREGFVSSRDLYEMKEFLVKGENDCVSVLSIEKPTVSVI